MFTPHLFTHIYDIDTIISGLCGKKTVYLNTSNGTLQAEAPGYLLTPLPESFFKNIPNHTEFNNLTPNQQKEVLHIISQPETLQEHLQSTARSGGWLRERLKEAALDWLDINDLIPPSMKHLNRQKAPELYATTVIKKVTIS